MKESLIYIYAFIGGPLMLLAVGWWIGRQAKD